jgi:hypothetical protein
MPVMVSPHISFDEYACPCCKQVPSELKSAAIYSNIFSNFEFLRKAWGPLKINSAFRCPKHNSEVGGEPLSVHMFGAALDLDCTDEAMVNDLFQLVESLMPQLRCGKYTKKGTFIHIDNAYFIVPRISPQWREGARWTG